MNSKSSILLHNFYHHCDQHQLPVLDKDYFKYDSTVQVSSV